MRRQFRATLAAASTLKLAADECMAIPAWAELDLLTLIEVAEKSTRQAAEGKWN
jgi:hypothetical protein